MSLVIVENGVEFQILSLVSFLTVANLYNLGYIQGITYKGAWTQKWSFLVLCTVNYPFKNDLKLWIYLHKVFFGQPVFRVTTYVSVS